MSINPFDNFTPEPWTSEAFCASHPTPDLWFAGDGVNGSTAGPFTRLAQSLCDTACPVQAECLAFAVANSEQHGVYGGLTASERRNLTIVAA